MIDKFLDYVKTEGLFDKGDTILLGISGGIDSMVMLDLLIKSSCSVAVAHCNFGLRGEESDSDQYFVENICSNNNIICHTRLFDTQEYAFERGISIQMAARELRFEWFSELSSRMNYSYTGIGHNKNDLVETFLLNISRGTGIKGLTGIKSKNGRIVRPLLFASRKEISFYAQVNNVAFREDTSNIDLKYKRNRIRLRIIPEFEKLSPSFTDIIAETADRLKDADIIFMQNIDYHYKRLYNSSGQGGYFYIDQLLNLKPLKTYLFEFLKRWHFQKNIIPDIVASLQSAPGKQFYSSTHRLVKDREKLIVSPLTEKGITRYYIEEGISEVHSPVKMKLRVIDINPGFSIPASASVACMDLDAIHFPLILRKWEKGDYFQPLGMSGLKKVSDFFTDNKFSLIDKEDTWLIVSGNKVAWIVGHRLDNRFRITSLTRKALLIELVD